MDASYLKNATNQDSACNNNIKYVKDKINAYR